MKKLLNLGSGPDIREGFDNLDPETPWHWQDGLPYADESVDGITVGCMLYLIPDEDWAAGFAEIARVLKPGGVIRFTEAYPGNEPSWERSLVFPVKVKEALWAVGIWGCEFGQEESMMPELMNARRGDHVFQVEGAKT